MFFIVPPSEARKGRRIAGPEREIYLRNRADHGVEPDDFVTEIEFPVVKVG